MRLRPDFGVTVSLRKPSSPRVRRASCRTHFFHNNIGDGILPQALHGGTHAVHTADADFGQSDFGHPCLTDFGQSNFGQTDYGQKKLTDFEQTDFGQPWLTLAKPTLAKIGVSVFSLFLITENNKMKKQSMEEQTPEGWGPEG